MTGDELDDWLRQSHPKPTLPPSFQREVWARVAQAQALSPLRLWEHRLSTLLDVLSRPAPAAFLLIALLILGATSGALSSRPAPTEQRHAYLVAIDPLYPARHAHPE